MTVPPDVFPPEPPPTGWFSLLWRLAGPAFYATSWAPWLRIMTTAVVVVFAVVVLRTT